MEELKRAPRCATCKHWQASVEYETGHSQGIGRCEATPMFWDQTEWNEEGDDRVIKPSAAKTTAFVQDGSDYKATLYTRPEHGCTMHDTMTGPKPSDTATRC